MRLLFNPPKIYEKLRIRRIFHIFALVRNSTIILAKKFEIRNSTAEFLTFISEEKEDGIQVLYKDENIWATQKAMAELFDVGIPAISKHLKNIFEEGELQKDVVVSKMEITTQHGAIEGKTQTSQVEFYNLDAIISVGYRVNTEDFDIQNQLK